MALDDLPQIAALFGTVFRNGRTLRNGEIIDHMRAIYLEGPWFDANICSIVHMDGHGRIDGFFGVTQVPMLWQGAPIRVAVTGTLMVADLATNPLAAVRMAKAHLAGQQDMTVCDTANRISLDLAQGLNFTVLTSHGLEWNKVLRPSGVGLEWLRGRGHVGLARLCGLAARAVDHGLRRFGMETEMPAPGVLDHEIDISTFVEHAVRLIRPYALRPDWDAAGLEWQIRLAAQKEGWGPLHIRQVTNQSGKLMGAFLYYGKAGSVAVALQVLAIPGMATKVLASLCRHAAESDCVAVRGQTSPSLMEGLFRTAGVFYRHRAATVVHSKNPELTQAAMNGTALLGGLVGDTWTRLTSDFFD